jgi:hypothetical protein
VQTNRRILKRFRVEAGAALCYKQRFARRHMSKPSPITAIRGFRDVLPEETRRWQLLERAARRLFETYGFGEIELPVVERTELFAHAVGETSDIVEKEMFSFRDRDREETPVSLRLEATASVVRAYLENSLVRHERQARLYYVGPDPDASGAELARWMRAEGAA